MDHKTVKQWMFAICIENPVIQRKGEFKWKRGSSRWNEIPPNGGNYLCLAFTGLINLSVIYTSAMLFMRRQQCPWLADSTFIREPPAYSSNLLYGSPNLPEHINFWAFLGGGSVWCWVCMLQKRQSLELKSPEAGNFLHEKIIVWGWLV